MKIKNLLLVLLLSVSSIALCQPVNITTDTVMYVIHDVEQQAWVDFSTPDKWSTRFVINEQFTLMTHTTPTMESTYYLSEVSNEIKSNGFITCVAVSDVGNYYFMVINLNDNTLRMAWETDKGETVGLFYRIKSIW